MLGNQLKGFQVGGFFCGTGVVDDTIHVWCIYLLLVVFNGKIWSMQVNISYIDAMGDIYIYPLAIITSIYCG